MTELGKFATALALALIGALILSLPAIIEDAAHHYPAVPGTGWSDPNPDTTGCEQRYNSGFRRCEGVGYNARYRQAQTAAEFRRDHRDTSQDGG